MSKLKNRTSIAEQSKNAQEQFTERERIQSVSKTNQRY